MQTIWAKGLREQKNQTLAFLYNTIIPENAFIEIVASNVYRLFINDDFIGYGPARAAHGYTRKDRYSLSDYGNKDIHIVIEVFAANVNSYYIVDELPFFGSCITCGDKEVATAKDFKAFYLTNRVQKVQRYSFQRPFAESYTTSVPKEVETEEVNCNKIIDRNIDYPIFEKINYVNEIEFGEVFINKENPKWEDRCLKGIDEHLNGYKYEELDECISDEVSEFDYRFLGEKSENSMMKSNSYKLFEFGRTLTGFFYLKLNVAEKTTLYLIWDEIIWNENKKEQKEKNICFYRNTCCNIIKYTLEMGEYRLLSFEPTSAQFAKIIVLNGEIEIKDFSMVLYENKNAYNLKFNCNDKQLNEIVQAAENTFSQNAVDILMDCPSRERAGWLCDAYFSGRAEKLFTGKNEIEKNFLENFVLSPQLVELPQGMLPMCYPADHYNGVYIPNWSMWFVLELKDYYKRTADKDLVEKSKEKIYSLINFFKKYLNEDGLLEDLESWVFIEWSKCNDEEYIKGVNYPSNMLYSAMLSAAGALYHDNELISQSQRMKETIIGQAFNGAFFEDNKIRENGKLVSKNHLTETCQYYAFYFDIAKKEEFPALFETMVSEFGPKRKMESVYPDIAKSNAIVGNYLRLEILLANEYSKKVIEECKAFFFTMSLRTGTLWEHSFASGSLNHGFASVAGNYIVEALTGFERADYVNKIIYLNENFLNMDLEMTIPILGDCLKINIANGVRNVIKPQGYEIRSNK